MTRKLRFRAMTFGIALLAGLGATACSDSTTAPVQQQPALTLTIAPPAASVYETDDLTMRATLRNAQGQEQTGVPVTWTASDPSKVELEADGSLIALRAGTVRITASAGGAQAAYDLVILPLDVQQVVVLPTPLRMERGDIRVLGVIVRGQGGRTVLGKSVTITSDDPSVAVIDAAGRVRAVAPGTTTIRATSAGVVGTTTVEVLQESALLHLSRHDGGALPKLVAADSVSWDGVREYHEVYVEAGVLMLTGGATPRYEMDVRYAEYDVRTVNGVRSMQLRRVSREFDRGRVHYDARGDLQMVSEYISPLSHTAIAGTTGIDVRFRIPGTDEIMQLHYRREPK